MKKKVLAIALAAIMVIGIRPMAAFAGKHHVRMTTAKYSLCNETDCDITGVHKHGKVSYLGHYLNDGHDYHVVCEVTGCQRIGEHEYGEFCVQSAGYGCGSYAGTNQKGLGCRR